MSLNKEETRIVHAMRRYGGSFIGSLAQAIVEADQGHFFAKALIEMRAKADDTNRNRVIEAFPNIWDVYGMDETTRRAVLMGAYADEVAQYAKFTEEQVDASH